MSETTSKQPVPETTEPQPKAKRESESSLDGVDELGFEVKLRTFQVRVPADADPGEDLLVTGEPCTQRLKFQPSPRTACTALAPRLHPPCAAARGVRRATGCVHQHR